MDKCVFMIHYGTYLSLSLVMILDGTALYFMHV